MELLGPVLAFGLLVAVVALVGIALGRAMAPRLTAWDDARARATDEASGEEAGDGGDRDGGDGDGD